MPLIKHAIVLYMLLTTIGTVTVFGLIYFLTRGGPGGDTTTLSIFVYERAFKFFEIGLGSAASVIMLGVVLGIGLDLRPPAPGAGLDVAVRSIDAPVVRSAPPRPRDEAAPCRSSTRSWRSWRCSA